jgi:hypothetical protein
LRHHGHLSVHAARGEQKNGGQGSKTRDDSHHRTYTLDQIRIAHADMEANNATGKLVVVL